MIRRWQSGLALFSATALLSLTGLPLAAIQAWAWGTMFARYAEFMPVEDALSFTFSGQEMCGYCDFVARAADPEQAQLTLLILQEVRLFVASSDPLKTAAMATTQRPTLELVANPGRRLEQPLDPPPRGVA